MTDEDKPKGFSGDHNHPPPRQPQPYPTAYGTFQGVSNYPPPPPDPHPAIGFPHPVPPPGAGDPSAPAPPYYPPGYQAVPGYAVAEGRPVRERRLGCCGLGCGWCLFILGFFLAGIPWYVGAIIMLCSRVDYREKPGYIACIVAISPRGIVQFHRPIALILLALLATIAIILGVTKGADDW